MKMAKWKMTGKEFSQIDEEKALHYPLVLSELNFRLIVFMLRYYQCIGFSLLLLHSSQYSLSTIIISMTFIGLDSAPANISQLYHGL